MASCLVLGDFFEKVKEIEDNSIDMVWADIPYGVTDCKWDKVWPLETMWQEFKRVARSDNTPMVFTATEPFNVDLINSNRKMFKYSWIWHKNQASNFANGKRMPMKYHEMVLVFYNKPPVYNPILTESDTELAWSKSYATTPSSASCYGDFLSSDPDGKLNRRTIPFNKRYPSSIQQFKCVHNQVAKWENRIRHPTEKPVELVRYMIETYTNPGDTILDPCMGTGSSAIAAMRSKRNYIGIELDEEYYRTTKLRRVKERLKG